MKRLILLVALVMLVMMLAGSSAPAVSDTSDSLTENNIPRDEIATNQTKASNSSAGATITTTMYTGDAD